MLQKSLLISLLILLLILPLILLLAHGTYASETAGRETGSRTADTIKCRYFNRKDFFLQISSASGKSPGQKGIWSGQAAAGSGQTGFWSGQEGVWSGQTYVWPSRRPDTPEVGKSGGIIGGIVPHHLLAGAMISDFFKTVSEARPDVVVVLAPNHKRSGLSRIHTSAKDWETPFGMLAADKAGAGLLQKELDAAESRSLMEEEYSISGLVPYIKYYMPDAKLLPILLHGDFGRENSDKLGALLSDAAKNGKYAILASVDFSHYLPVEAADKMDGITLEAIMQNKAESISLMGNDNLDSPPSIMALLAAMAGSGAAHMELLDHGNSFRLTGSGRDYTTSYFSIVFRRAYAV